MIVCLCNGLTDEQVAKICDGCETREEFIAAIKEKVAGNSCMTCYADIVSSFCADKEDDMENNPSFYRAEYESLLTQLSLMRKQLEKQEALLRECYDIIHYKKLWLTLSDECIEDMEKYILDEKGEDK